VRIPPVGLISTRRFPVVVECRFRRACGTGTGSAIGETRKPCETVSNALLYTSFTSFVHTSDTHRCWHTGIERERGARDWTSYVEEELTSRLRLPSTQHHTPPTADLFAAPTRFTLFERAVPGHSFVRLRLASHSPTVYFSPTTCCQTWPRQRMCTAR
jgi:hypothetical protein